MSRIGKLPVIIPDKVKVSVENNIVKVDGPKGSLEKVFNSSIDIKVENDSIVVSPANRSRLAKAMYGTGRSIINNMVTGVVDGYSKSLIISGVGFRAVVNGSILDLNLGYSHPIKYSIPVGITVTVTENTKLKVDGLDKQLVGQVAAEIKKYYPVEPYKAKGVRIVGDYVRRKEGKKAG